MESSSEDEFAWTSASSDTTGSDSEVEMAYEEESESDKTFKRKLKKELLLNGHHNEHGEPTDEKPRHKKKVKREKKSQSPSPASRPNGHDAALDAEHMLRMKVKEERASFVVSRTESRGPAEPEPEPRSPRKKKKRRRETDRDTGDDRLDSDAAAEPRKKKRKRESSRLESSIDETPDPIIDKFEAEETVVETRRPEPKVRSEGGAPEKPFTSKEFVDDDDSDSGDERRAPRISERITFEDEPEPEPRSPRKKKKRRRETERDTGDDRLDSDAAAEPRKKKRKRESSRLESSIDDTPDPIIDKFEAEETVVETRRPEPKVRSEGGAPEKPFTSKEFIDDDDSDSGDERRAPRISERITFEDEPEARPSTSPSPAASSAVSPAASAATSRAASPPRAGAGRLGRFLRRHAHMQPVIAAFEPGAGVGPDDDVWLVEGPRDLPAAALLGATLRPGARHKLAAGGRGYEAAPAPRWPRVTLLARLGGLVLRAVPLRGALRLRERVPRVRAPQPAPHAEPDRIPLPPTRRRHPLLGAGRVRAAPTSEPRAPPVAPVAPEARREKKKKKKKHRERPEPDAAVAPEPEPEPEPAPRKRKRSARNGTEEPSESETPEKPKKEKKEKRRRDDAALWDSERAIEESLFGC